jgi:N-acetylneuraminic acid mutarotase
MEVYDPRNNKWEVKAPLPQPRSGYAMTSLEGRLYLFGGWDGEKVTDTIFSYDPINDEWSEMSSMPVAIAYMDAVTVGSKIYIAGGWNESTSIDSLYIYIPNREISLEYPWDKQSLQITPSCPIRISTIANSIFLLGGSQTCKQPFLNFREDSSVFYQYQTLTNEWILIDSPKFISSSPAIIAYGDYLFIFGGYASDGYSAKNVSYQAVFTTTIPVIINGQ